MQNSRLSKSAAFPGQNTAEFPTTGSSGLLALFMGIILVSVLAFSGCASKETAHPEPVVTVQMAAVQQQSIQRVVTADALLYPLDQTPIVPKISAPIRKFYVDRGSHVHRGELVAELENEDLAAAVAQSKGAYEEAQAAYATATQITVPANVQAAQLKVQETEQAMRSAQLVYQSRLKLYQSGAIARNLMDQSHTLYIQARNQYEIAEAALKGLQSVGRAQQIKTAEGQLAAAKGAYLAALAQYNYSLIHSTMDGVVTDRPLYEGEMASAGSPLMTIMNISHVVARAHISPQEASLLKIGDPAIISPGQDQPGIPGKVTVVSPALDPSSTTVQVWVDAANPGDRLKPGATVTISMVARTVKNALTVPAEAVVTAADGSTSVMVVGSDGRAHQTNVKTGIRQGDRVQILSGLQAGEQVVTEGAYGLPDGTKVKS